MRVCVCVCVEWRPTDLLQAAQQVLPLLELLNADDYLVSGSFGHLLQGGETRQGTEYTVHSSQEKQMTCGNPDPLR